MFTGYNKCYFMKYRVSGEGFLQVSNYTNLMIYFIIQYNTLRGIKTKKSTILTNGKSYKIFFTDNATNVCFNILTSPDEQFICNKVLKPGELLNYYNVIQTTAGVVCVEQ